MKLPTVVKCHPTNFTPLVRTPWAGGKICQVKRKSGLFHMPELSKVGESWEVSTDNSFLSLIPAHGLSLLDFLAQAGISWLGDWYHPSFRGQIPYLLKWLSADDVLSVQVHPQLQGIQDPDQCGKPESWLVLHADPGAFVYLGLRSHVDAKALRSAIGAGQLDDVLFRYFPKTLDYISIPPGCVHAIGPGLLIEEPQAILPGKTGATFRLFDWKRRYNSHGVQDEHGEERPLNLTEGLAHVDWHLPREADASHELVLSMDKNRTFKGNKFNPFALSTVTQVGSLHFQSPCEGSPTAVTVWQGKLDIWDGGQFQTFVAGESGLLSSSIRDIQVKSYKWNGENPMSGFFSLERTFLKQLYN